MGYDGVVVVGTKLDTKDFEAEINYVEKKLNDMIADYQTLSKEKGFNEQSNQAIELRKNIQKVSNQLNDLKEKQKKINQGGLPNLKEIMEDIGKSTKQTIKSIGRWALAIFSLRSAYMLIRNAINTIAGNDEQLKTDIDYMKNALAYSLEPIIRRIVDFAQQLMFYVGYIIKAWTGRNIFENANKSLANANKNAQKLSKTMAGFDEMNVLSDSSSGSSGGVAPSFDLSAPEDIKPPAWIEFIAQNKDVILGVIAGLSTGLIAMKLGLRGIKSLGIGAIVAGVVMLIQDILDMIKNPSWENFVAILSDVAIVIGGIMLVMGNWWGLLVVIIGLIVKLVVENWDKIKGILGTIGKWIFDYVIMPVVNIIDNLFHTLRSIILAGVSVINGIFTTLINILANPFIVAYETAVNVFNGIKKTIQGVFDVIAGLFTGDWKRVMDGFKNIFKGVFDTLWSIAKAPLNLIIGGINALIKGANKIKFDVPDWVPGLGGKKFGFNIPTIPKLAVGGIVNMPSRGVPIGGAIAGEAGAEGVIPLTDTQAMETLGATIGKYITINANITNTMNGRVISRELQKINTNNDFAMNR